MKSKPEEIVERLERLEHLVDVLLRGHNSTVENLAAVEMQMDRFLRYQEVLQGRNFRKKFLRDRDHPKPQKISAPEGIITQESGR